MIQCVPTGPSAIMASIIRRSFVSPAADASSNVFEPKTYSLSSQMLNNVTWWQLAVTFFLGLVVYDQRRTTRSSVDISRIMLR